MRSLWLRAAVIVLPLLPATAQAAEIGQFTVGGGYFDLFDDEGAAALNTEWRPGVRYFDVISPFVGGLATTDGSLYGYAGFGLDFEFGNHFVVIPFTGVGLYHDGGGKDLGGTIEFRSGVELAYRFDDGSQLGVSGFHLSNAGIYDDNPGTEIIMLQYSLPTSWLME